ncbi:MAG: N-acetyl-gamma-glutamyl-phosphate reductase [Bacteroidota bacterium]|nr:N-acetyl-gamma-glutamyl-phosphate reductase [Bacteroidota bacterium]
MSKIKAGIIGATGYTGSELVRIIKKHPDVALEIITSESRAGEKFSDVHAFFQDIEEQELKSIKEIDHYDLDVAFLALPHGVSMNFVKEHAGKDFKIIDLSGDFRLKPKDLYEEWYHTEHIFSKGIEDAVFGSPELFADKIKTAKLVANPGCYPTSAILASAPLLMAEYVDPKSIIIDSKSGVTGAGIKAKTINMYSNVNDNFKAYGLKTHRHTIEIQYILESISKSNVLVQFTPHLLPVDRGILSTTYLRPIKEVDENELNNVFKDFYADAPFIRIRENPPAIKDVKGTNYCDININYDPRTNMIIIISVIDNLVKGAAGQAVQNMNIMFGLDERQGLRQIPVNP